MCVRLVICPGVHSLNVCWDKMNKLAPAPCGPEQDKPLKEWIDVIKLNGC